jgi:hypothetical protein
MATSRSKSRTKKHRFEETFFLDTEGTDAIASIPVKAEVPSDQDILAIATALFLLTDQTVTTTTPTRAWSTHGSFSELR